MSNKSKAPKHISVTNQKKKKIQGIVFKVHSDKNMSNTCISKSYRSSQKVNPLRIDTSGWGVNSVPLFYKVWIRCFLRLQYVVYIIR